MELDEDYLKDIRVLIERKEGDAVKSILSEFHPADIAELCNDLEPEEARFAFRLLDNEIAADVLVEMDEDSRAKFLELLPPEIIAKRFVDNMNTDDAVDIMRDMNEEKQEEKV